MSEKAVQRAGTMVAGTLLGMQFTLVGLLGTSGDTFVVLVGISVSILAILLSRLVG